MRDDERRPRHESAAHQHRADGLSVDGTHDEKRDRAAFQLRPYQVEALAAIEDAERRGVRRPLVALPTGTGKTVIFAHLIAKRRGRALVLAHRDELISQAVDKLRLIDPGVTIGVVKADRNEIDAPVVVASVQTVSRPKRLEQLHGDDSLLAAGDGFATVVVDEAHHAAAATYRRVLEHVGSFEPSGPLTIGFTATPERGDRIGLDSVFGEIVYERAIVEMIAEHYLCDLRGLAVSVGADLDSVRVRRGDFAEGELGRELMECAAPEAVARAYAEHAASRRGLVFTPTVEVAHAVASELRDAGVAAEALDATTPLDERRAILHRLRDGITRVVSNCGVLTEGFDEPSVSAIVVARPTKSRPLYVQMVGRGTRLHPGKADCLVIDVTGVSSRHSLMGVATLAGLRPGEVSTERSVTEALEARQDAGATLPFAGELIAQAVDLFRKRPMRWLQAGERYVLAAGDGVVALEPDATGWRVIFRSQSERSVITSGLPLEYAQGVGEDHVRQLGAKILADPGAPWRSKPATDKQRLALRRWRIPVGAELTRGEAADLLTAAIGRVR